MVLIQTAYVRINAAERARLPDIWLACAKTFVVGRIETEGTKRCNRGTSVLRQSRSLGNVAAIRCSRGLDRGSSAKSERICNCSRRRVLIEERNISSMVNVGSNQIVQAYVANVIRCENQSRS